MATTHKNSFTKKTPPKPKKQGRSRTSKRPQPLSKAEDAAAREKVGATLDLAAFMNQHEKNSAATKQHWETPE